MRSTATDASRPLSAPCKTLRLQALVGPQVHRRAPSRWRLPELGRSRDGAWGGAGRQPECLLSVRISRAGRPNGQGRATKASGRTDPAQTAFPAWARTPNECLAELSVSADRGLSSDEEEATARLQRYGPNELERHALSSVWKLVHEQFELLKTRTSASCSWRSSSRSCSRSTTAPRAARLGSPLKAVPCSIGTAFFLQRLHIWQFRGRVSHLVQPIKSNWMLNINPQLQFCLLIFASEIIWFRAFI